MTVTGWVNLGGRPSADYHVRWIHPRTGEFIDSASVEEDGTFRFEGILEDIRDFALFQMHEELDRTTSGPERAGALVLGVP